MMKKIKVGSKVYKFYTISEVGKMLGISDKTVRLYVREGKIAGRKIGKEWYITRKEILDFIINCHHK